MKNKLQKLMVNGEYVKVNGRHIWSNGYFAYDGCHKIYILESEKDVKQAMKYGYRLYPVMELQKTYEDSCPLKFIENLNFDKQYVKQGQNARWTTVKAPKKDIDAILKEI